MEGENSEKSETKQNGRHNLPQLFKPGQSGNPKGKPKGLKSISTMLKEALREKAKNMKTGQPIIVDGKEVTWQEALIVRIIDKAIVKGDYKTLNMLIERLEGKVATKINFNDETQQKDRDFGDLRKIVSILSNGNITPEKEDSSEAGS